VNLSHLVGHIYQLLRSCNVRCNLQLWYQHKQVRESRGTRHYEYSCRMPVDAFKPQDGLTGTNNSDMDVGEINLADMNPEDIRVITRCIT
jgi:hypothetical protein